MKPTSYLNLVVITLVCLLSKPVCGQNGYQIEQGTAHPDFILPSIEDGKAIQLSDYRGKKVLLMHFASW